MANDPILSARGLIKRYGKVTALDNADFDLYPGEILAVIGDNGAGKSSLIKAISGAITPDEGEIRLEASRYSSARPSRRARRDRDRLSEPGAVTGAVDCRQHVPRPRTAQAGVMGSVFRKLDRPPWKSLPATAFRTRPDDHPEYQPGGGDAFGRPAPRGGRGARRRLRLQGGHSRRADRSAGVKEAVACWN